MRNERSVCHSRSCITAHQWWVTSWLGLWLKHASALLFLWIFKTICTLNNTVLQRIRSFLSITSFWGIQDPGCLRRTSLKHIFGMEVESLFVFIWINAHHQTTYDFFKPWVSLNFALHKVKGDGETINNHKENKENACCETLQIITIYM